VLRMCSSLWMGVVPGIIMFTIDQKGLLVVTVQRIPNINGTDDEN